MLMAGFYIISPNFLGLFQLVGYLPDHQTTAALHHAQGRTQAFLVSIHYKLALKQQLKC